MVRQISRKEKFLGKRRIGGKSLGVSPCRPTPPLPLPLEVEDLSLSRLALPQPRGFGKEEEGTGSYLGEVGLRQSSGRRGYGALRFGAEDFKPQGLGCGCSAAVAALKTNCSCVACCADRKNSAEGEPNSESDTRGSVRREGRIEAGVACFG